jgi:hypothetical protein
LKNSHILIVCPVIALSACAEFGANYEPILDGAPSVTYQIDLQACQTLARNQSQFDEETLGVVVAAGLLGAVIADHDGSGTVVEGLIGGALAGLVGGVFEAGDQRQDIVVECMRGRGHRVVG